jgi:hypothetical protein
VRGDPSKQVFCAAHHRPKLVHADVSRRCVQCGASFLFRAEEQRFWYEALRFHFDSVPTRCPACRRSRRSEAVRRERIALARARTRASAADPSAWLELAELLVRHRQETGRGSLTDAIAAARRARRLRADAPTSHFWEGIAHALAGRRERAVECLRTFLDRPGLGRRSLRAHAIEAREVLEGGPS